MSLNQFGDVSMWTNKNFADWLKLVNLQAFLPNLAQSGLHGGIVADNSFTADFLFLVLAVPVDEAKYQNMRKILDDEIKLLKKSKT